MKKIQKILWITMLIVILGMTATTVKADYHSCSAEDLARFKQAIKDQDLNYDYNNDGVVNLSDAGFFAQQCREEEVKISLPQKKTGNGIKVIPQEDGSISYIFKAHAYQIEKGTIIRWTRGYWGTVTYKEFLITIQDGTGVNVRKL